MDQRQESILLDRTRDGDEGAFEELVLRHSAQIVNLALRLVGNRDDAQEIAQETFLRLHRTLGSFRGDCSLATWLYRTTLHLAIDFLRREKLRRRIFLFRRNDPEEEDPVEAVPDPGASPRDQLLARETARRLRRALDRLSPRQRAVFVLRHQEELPLKEIASLLGLEEGTVKVHLHRAVKILRQDLQRHEGDSHA